MCLHQCDFSSLVLKLKHSTSTMILILVLRTRTELKLFNHLGTRTKTEFDFRTRTRTELKAFSRPGGIAPRSLLRLISPTCDLYIYIFIYLDVNTYISSIHIVLEK